MYRIPRKYLHFTISLGLIAMYLLLPGNRQWMQNRLFWYYKGFMQQAEHLDLEYRKKQRWGNRYVYAMQVANFFGARTGKDTVLVLVPPAPYFRERGLEFEVPEPAVFYYYTGLRTTWAHHHLATKANWYVRVQEGRLVIDSVTNRYALMDSIRLYRRYPYTL